jgi:hypothetical protein
MDYLGINLPTPEPPGSDDKNEAPNSELSAVTPGGNKPTSGSIAWSRASMPESVTEQYPGTIKKPQMSPVPPQVQGIGVLVGIKFKNSGCQGLIPLVS